MSSKKSSKRVRKPDAIILDIEGTTTDSTFVRKTLFPVIRKNFEKFLDETYDSSDTKDMIVRLRQLQKSGALQGMPTIVIGNKEQVIRSLSENLKWQMTNHILTSELKILEVMCWHWAYQNNLIQAHIYDDVSPSLHEWKTKFGLKIYVFSSGIALAQQLLFVNTIHGNIYPLIEDFFDSTIGLKTDVESYKLISNRIGIEVNKLLFITDDPKEAKAALSAGLQAIVIKRSGNKATDQFPDIPRINSFKEIRSFLI